MVIPFVGGSYSGRSIAIDCQQTMNFYPEVNDQGSKSSISLIGTPGLRLFSEVTSAGAWRGIFASGNDRLFGVVGNKFIEFDTAGVQTVRGTINTFAGIVTFAENVNLTDNTTQIMFVDGTEGWVFQLDTNLLTKIVNGNPGDYEPGTHVIYKDGTFIQNQSGTNKFIFSQLGQYDGLKWDSGLDYYAAEGSADNVEAIGKVNNEIWVFGAKSIEVWYATGNSDDPFSRVNNAYIDIGISAKYSIGTINNTIFWIGSNSQGNRVVFSASGYTPQRISTHAIEYMIGKVPDVSDAIGYCYQQEGHYFYVLSFQGGNITLVYDMTTGLWHERGYLNTTTGNNDRHLGICSTYWNNKTMVGDYANGKLYYYDLDYYTDNGNSIKRIRQGTHIHTDRKRMSFFEFEIDLERGIGLVTGQGEDPQVMLQFSDDGGFSWSNELWASAGKIGDRLACVSWRRLGMSRDRVWRITMTDPVKWIINGARVDMSVEN